MAEKNIQMQRKTATGYDKYYPKTQAGLVEFADGTTVEAHLADDASTTTKGHVQLSSSTSSTSTSLAATASAVKTVNDALTSHKAAAAPHSGHETPTGAQAKADAAETSAKSYADNIGTALSGIIGSLGSLLTTVKTNIVAAINSLKSELDAHKAENVHQYEELKYSELSSTAMNVDDEGVYKNIEWERKDGTLYAKSTLLGTSPTYNQIKIDYYNGDGTEIIKSITWDLTYDNNDFPHTRTVI